MANILKIWDESKQDYVGIPAIQGEKGKPFKYEDFTDEQLKELNGKPGVYYGTEAPTDVHHPVWINLEGSYTNTNSVVVTNLEYTNITVPVSDFIEDTTYSDLKFNYRASIELEGCDTSMTPEVIPSLKDIISGNLAPIAVPYNGGIYIYTKKLPTEDVIIETINLMKGN